MKPFLKFRNNGFNTPITDGLAIAALLTVMASCEVRFRPEEHIIGMLIRQSRMAIIDGLILNDWKVYGKDYNGYTKYMVLPKTSNRDMKTFIALTGNDNVSDIADVIADSSMHAYGIAASDYRAEIRQDFISGYLEK